MKQCKKCLQQKEYTSFYKHPQTKDGFMNKCISCILEYNNSEYGRARQRIQDKNRLHNPKRIEQKKMYFEKFKLEHPEKRSAQILIGNLKRNKRNKHLLTDTCVVCGSIGLIHYHHFDYSKPTEVIPCCPMCHSKFHHDKISVLDEYKVTFV